MDDMLNGILTSRREANKKIRTELSPKELWLLIGVCFMHEQNKNLELTLCNMIYSAILSVYIHPIRHLVSHCEIQKHGPHGPLI